MYSEICQTELSAFQVTIHIQFTQSISLNSMGKIVEGINKMNFTMLYGNYCYNFIDNFP